MLPYDVAEHEMADFRSERTNEVASVKTTPFDVVTSESKTFPWPGIRHKVRTIN